MDSPEARRPSWRRGALAGVLAAVAGLGAAELVAGLLGVQHTPVVAIGQAFIGIVPGWLERSAIRLLGTADKPVLLGGVVLVIIAAAAGIGVLTSRIRKLGLGVVVAAAAAVALLSAYQPDATVTAALPALAAGLAALIVLPVLLNRFDSEDAGRRQLLLGSGIVVVGALAGAGLGRLGGGNRAGVEEARSTLKLPLPPSTAMPPGASLSADGLSPWRTANEVFYRIDTALRVPLVDPADWQLRVHGMVDKPITLTFEQLLKRRIVHRWVTLTCVSNEVGGDLVGNALWSGVRLSELLEEAGVHADADAVQSTSQDGWTCGTPLSALTDGRDAMLAFAMNGAALPVNHGFPVRMVVPGLYGYVSATKWVVDIEVTRFDRFKAFWSTRGWAEKGPIKTASRIDVPREGTGVSPGPVVVAGLAWAQHRGVSKVEVRVDDGPWQEAKLAGQPTKDSWRQWKWTWQAAEGEHQLQVRATDGSGAVQTAAVAPPAPDGSSGYHTISLNVS
ncbi:molybdopterin-binding protein [Flindersiella endophytica]